MLKEATMAKDTSSKKQDKKPDKNKKSFFAKVKTWYKGITSELKKVTWPDKTKFKKNLAAVLVIIVVAVVTILVFDSLISMVLNVTGFYDVKQAPSAAPAPGVTAPLEPETETADEAETAAKDAAETEAPAEDTETPAEDAEATEAETTKNEG